MILVQPEKRRGKVKPLHGVNLGPMTDNTLLDFSASFKELKIPSVRLHDANLTGLDLVDLHCLFPDPKADPNDPANYSFAQTDDYLAAIRAVGADIYFRLGESIEHQPHKKYVRPERWPSAQRMADVCAHIVRHYNQGWANGFEWNIRYWEFWNEPDLGDTREADTRQCWTGTADQFYDFYAAAAQAIKQADPSVKVGMAGFASYWFAVPEGEYGYVPDDPYRNMVQRAIAAGLPIDFISWHRYARSWRQIEDATRTMRSFLDRSGLSKAESHLTEWAWLPEIAPGVHLFTTWQTKKYDEMERSLELMSGAGSAAFIFGVLARLQDLPVELAHYYTGVASAFFGIFTGGGMPKKNYTGIELFRQFLDGTRVEAKSDDPESHESLAIRDGRKLTLGIASLDPSAGEIPVRIDGAQARVTQCRQFTDDGWRTIAPRIDEAGTIHLPRSGWGLTQLSADLSAL